MLSARRALATLVALPLIAAVGACSSAGDGDQATAAAPVTTPPTPVASAALATIAESQAARTRIGYVNVDRVRGDAWRLSQAEIGDAILGRAHRDEVRPGRRLIAVTDGLVAFDGRTRTVIGGRPGLRRLLAQDAPVENAIASETAAAVQACIGDPAASVVVGPEVVGDKAAVGAAIAVSDDPPARRQLRICAAPHYHRDLGPTIARLKREFHTTGSPVVGEEEIGERDIVVAVIAADRVPRTRLAAILRGGADLRGLMAKGRIEP